MKLLSLNLWGGKIFEPLIAYIREQGKDTDIFCFQEVFRTGSPEILTSGGFRANLFAELSDVLPNHFGYFDTEESGYEFSVKQNFDLDLGNAIFMRTGYKILDWGHDDTYAGGPPIGEWRQTPRNVQYLHLLNGTEVTIFNTHGLALKGNTRSDSSERLAQSKHIVSCMQRFPGKKILIGDLNIGPDTQSLKMLEAGNRNLIKESGIETTRNSYFKGTDKLGDYAVVSPDVTVQEFLVPNVDVSDHLPMVLQFS